MGRRLARFLLGACLLAWPAPRRRRYGPQLLETSLRLVAEARARSLPAGARELAGEALALIRQGVGFRLRDQVRRWLAGWLLDLRVAVRGLRRRPGFTAVSVATLALGMGGSVALFSLADAVLFRPPDYDRPDELVLVWGARPDAPERIPLSGPDAAILQERSELLTDLAFSIRGVDGALSARADEPTRHVRIAAVTPNLFATLGVEPGLGRAFDPALAPGSRPATALISHELWRTALGADSAVVGTQVRVNGQAVSVAGVLPEGFEIALPPDAGILADVDLWIPLSVPLTAFHRSEDRLLDQDSDNTGVVVARLSPGATVEEARLEIARISVALREEVPAYAEAGLTLEVRPLLDDATAHARPVLLPLLAGVVAVLLVAALNLAALLLARGTVRAPEFTVRRALGAGRGRLLRQLLVESALLAVLGLAGGLLLGQGALAASGSWIPPSLLPAHPLTLDLRALAFAGGLAGLVALGSGMAPGLRAGEGPLRSGGTGHPERAGAGGRRALVTAEVALSLALVVGAGLLLRTVGALHEVHPGFEAEGALTFRTSLRIPDVYRSPADRAAFMAEIGRKLTDLPGVEAAGLVGVLPLERRRWTQPWGLPGEPPDAWRRNRADFRVISSGAFRAMGTRVLEGRGFTAREDVVEGERVVVVDATLARRVAPHGSAVGATLGIPLDGSAVEARIVGVVEPVRYGRLDADGPGAIYVPYRQEASREVAFVVRGADPTALAPAVRRIVRELDPRIPVYDLETLDAYVDRAVAPRTFALSLVAGYALLALLCAGVGLYGVVSFDVGRARRAIGVRLALGATRRDVVGSVVASGLAMGMGGILAGALLGLGVGRLLGGLLFGVDGGDPVLWGSAVAVVLATTLLASWLPARRASRMDPAEALRPE